MLSIIGTLIGFGSSIVPEVLGYFKQKQANAQDLLMMEAKAKYASRLSELKLQELDIEAEITETKGLYEHDQSLDSGAFVNGLRGSVRPVLTYLFFLVFATVKGTLLYTAVQDENINFETAVLMIWDGETQAIFAAIIAFWFGNRAMSKARAIVSKK
jgi:hypothetical protein|tara:strand:- start:1145 stop:1615 length:471 start_codon:yes stop_codon:yes gene_type:complete